MTALLRFAKLNLNKWQDFLNKELVFQPQWSLNSAVHQSVLESNGRSSVRQLNLSQYWVMQPDDDYPKHSNNLQQNGWKRKDSSCYNDTVKFQHSHWLKCWEEPQQNCAWTNLKPQWISVTQRRVGQNISIVMWETDEVILKLFLKWSFCF